MTSKEEASDYRWPQPNHSQARPLPSTGLTCSDTNFHKGAARSLFENTCYALRVNIELLA